MGGGEVLGAAFALCSMPHHAFPLLRRATWLAPLLACLRHAWWVGAKILAAVVLSCGELRVERCLGAVLLPCHSEWWSDLGDCSIELWRAVFEVFRFLFELLLLCARADVHHCLWMRSRSRSRCSILYLVFW